jgi:hypothetical protein
MIIFTPSPETTGRKYFISCDVYQSKNNLKDHQKKVKSIIPKAVSRLR